METEAPVDIRLATEVDQAELQRMYKEQLRILHEFDASVEPGRDLEDDWWHKPDDLFAYLVYVDEKLAGFVLVMGKRYVEALKETEDFCLWELYVEPEHRGTGLAQRVTEELFARFPGGWFVCAMFKNERALKFWRRTLAKQTSGLVEGVTDEGFASFHFRSPRK